jgi:sarcosine oxidase subunit alpha
MALLRQPVKHSAMYRKFLALGATMTDHDGWQVPEQFTSPDEEARQAQQGVGLADVSWLVKLDVKGKDANPRLQIPDSNSVWRLAQGHWMVLSEPEATDTVIEKMQSAASVDSCAHVTDMTSVYAALLRVGNDSRDVLNRLTALDVSDDAMPDLSCAQTGLAHVHAIVLRQDVGEVLAYLLLAGREYGEYVWDALMHAGQGFGIVPFGLRAQRLLSR